MIELNFREWLAESLFKREIILVQKGAYNPIHRGHVQVFYHAKKFLLSQGYDVVGAYMIPSNTGYIQSKLAAKGELGISEEDRFALIKKALQGTFIKMLPIDREDAPVDSATIKKYVEKVHPGKEVMVVAGDDRVPCPTGPLCIVDKGWGKVISVNRSLSAGSASSSQVRANLMKTGDEPKMLSPAVRSYVKQHGLWGASTDH